MLDILVQWQSLLPGLEEIVGQEAGVFPFDSSP